MSARNQLDRYRAGVSVGMRPEEAQLLREMERRIKTLESYQKFAEMPAIQDFAQWAQGDIRAINDRLSTDGALLKDGREGERLAMLNRKDVLLYLLGLFDPSAELEAIEKFLSPLADRFEGYQEGRV